MEMSNDYIPELHVAQQRRRDKLRVQNFDDLQGQHNFHHHPRGCEPSPMILASELLHFPTASSGTTPYPNIHPTHFVVASSSDTCDPQTHLQQGCESWVPSNDNDQTTQHHVVDHNGRSSRQLSGVLPQFLPHCNMNQPSEFGYQNNGVGVRGWGNGENDVELPLLPHGLSLSLSSNQICEYQQHLGGGDGGGGGGGGGGGDPRELKPFEAGSISSIVKQSMCSNANANVNLLECGNNNASSSNNQVPDIAGGSIQLHRNVGPLGPFTGYAAILKSSKFLKPAQLLLDEFFAVSGIWRGGGELEDGSSVPSSRSRDVAECSTAIVPKIHGSNELTGSSPSCESYRPDCHEKKAKLLHMQEEVCKRHKQYHQQMQMVISAFDSVPGLSNATPYISRSIKIIMRHFRCLKNAITDQLQHIKRALGEDLSSPASFLKGETSSSSLRYDQNFVKVKSNSVGGSCHMGNQNHVWKPQRGLPERAVSILRAWLFDHFLHPYPTDNDKQMLATQTGLTRNQVSNWFINARVRLWKPMVEEIHMLETKTPMNSEPNSNDTVISVTAKNRQAAVGSNSGCKPTMNLGPCDTENLEHMGPLTSLERPRGVTNTEQLFQKCSRIESHQVPANMSNSFIGFLPYQRQGLELGGIGAVSLTLGLRHGSETSHQQLQHQFLPQGMPFGGHVIHDFSA